MCTEDCWIIVFAFRRRWYIINERPGSQVILYDTAWCIILATVPLPLELLSCLEVFRPSRNILYTFQLYIVNFISRFFVYSETRIYANNFVGWLYGNSLRFNVYSFSFHYESLYNVKLKTNRAKKSVKEIRTYTVRQFTCENKHNIVNNSEAFISNLKILPSLNKFNFIDLKWQT